MSHINRPYYKSEVKSKIGDYIRGKISAQSLMHPSRVNTKPIDKRKYNLHSGFHYEMTTPSSSSAAGVGGGGATTDYQRKVRRPPLKDYIEGKVKLCDMISPSKITYIPKERKYQNLLPPCNVAASASRRVFGAAAAEHHHHQRHRMSSFADSVETTSTVHREHNDGGAGGSSNKFRDEWDMGKCHPPPMSKMAATTTAATISSNGGGGAFLNCNQYSLVPIRTTGYGPVGKRKLMCKIKVQRGGDNSHGGGGSGSGGGGASAEIKTEEHIIEIPEKILRRGHHSLPKFLMDRYNIPCYVNGATAAAAAAAATSATKQQTSGKRKQQLSILGANGGGFCESNAQANNRIGCKGAVVGHGADGAGVRYCDTPVPGAAVADSASVNADRKFGAPTAIEYPVADGESAVSRVETNGAAVGGIGAVADSLVNKNNANSDGDNLPSEQGDYNNAATTYVFEFYEEEVAPETKSAIIEEIEDDHSNREYGGGGGAKLYAEDTRFDRRHNNIFNESLRSSGEFQHYEDFKSNIYVQRELMDLHRGMLKCDKNFMVVEHNVNRVMASLNLLETVQNQEIKPSIVAVKVDNEKMRLQLQALAAENEELKKSVQYLRKKTTDYDKVIYYIRQDSNMKMQELESKLETLTQTQVKSIEMQNTVNKNIIQITHGMKRVYTEQDSKHCCNSIKSPKNSNLTIS